MMNVQINAQPQTRNRAPNHHSTKSAPPFDGIFGTGQNNAGSVAVQQAQQAAYYAYMHQLQSATLNVDGAQISAPHRVNTYSGNIPSVPYNNAWGAPRGNGIEGGNFVGAAYGGFDSGGRDYFNGHVNYLNYGGPGGHGSNDNRGGLGPNLNGERRGRNRRHGGSNGGHSRGQRSSGFQDNYTGVGGGFSGNRSMARGGHSSRYGRRGQGRRSNDNRRYTNYPVEHGGRNDNGRRHRGDRDGRRDGNKGRDQWNDRRGGKYGGGAGGEERGDGRNRGRGGRGARDRRSAAENAPGLLSDLRQKIGPRDLEISDCAGYLVDLSKDQHGSRFIQQKLEICNDATKAIVFAELIPKTLDIVDDLFGNYVMQKLLLHGSPEQRMGIITSLRGHALELSCKMYGCRVIQKAFEMADGAGKMQLIEEFHDDVEKLVHDQNGNHVIQRCIQTVRPLSSIRFILAPFKGNIAALSRHPFGCRVVQRILENFSGTEEDSWVLREVVDNVDKLIEDQYGNYVVQHVLEHGDYNDKVVVAELVKKDILRLCRHKFGSNIVELVMKSMRQDFVEQLIDIMLVPEGTSEKDNSPIIPLAKMTTDSFANYVVQRVIRMANPVQLQTIRRCISLQADTLRNYSYGKHILACLNGQDERS